MSGRIVTLGEALGVLRTREVGTLAHLSELAFGTGGAEANVAIGASRLGAAAVYIGRVGADSVGQRIARELRAEGVDARLAIDPSAATGILIKESPRPGQTDVTFHRRGSAGSRIDPADLETLELTSDDILHVTGILPALSPSGRATLERALDLAESAGAAISFDVNHRSKLWSSVEASAVYRATAARATIVFAGEDEALLLGDLASLGVAEFVLKRGERGAVATIDGQAYSADAVKIMPVDTVGAGDAFVAGYLAARLEGATVPERLDLAVHCGALACLHPGDWEGGPTRAEIAAFGSGADPVRR
ncbi:sugar kinase [Glaciihabitans arcticus]|uniref:Sugar kinase n=1 Tax=Glaciihabitans arcticus TaxID=2668039 RepID=A0A4Q9H0T1_9MICO|nr:sugar kinase [Glaciihabitans arcticus]TBN58310.1 sugar kinase [Glaciihabitans arcticus]